jgi:hypothetical protein
MSPVATMSNVRIAGDGGADAGEFGDVGEIDEMDAELPDELDPWPPITPPARGPVFG